MFQQHSEDLNLAEVCNSTNKMLDLDSQIAVETFSYGYIVINIFSKLKSFLITSLILWLFEIFPNDSFNVHCITIVIFKGNG